MSPPFSSPFWFWESLTPYRAASSCIFFNVCMCYNSSLKLWNSSLPVYELIPVFWSVSMILRSRVSGSAADLFSAKSSCSISTSVSLSSYSAVWVSLIIVGSAALGLSFWFGIESSVWLPFLALLRSNYNISTSLILI